MSEQLNTETSISNQQNNSPILPPTSTHPSMHLCICLSIHLFFILILIFSFRYKNSNSTYTLGSNVSSYLHYLIGRPHKFVKDCVEKVFYKYIMHNIGLIMFIAFLNQIPSDPNFNPYYTSFLLVSQHQVLWDQGKSMLDSWHIFTNFIHRYLHQGRSVAEIRFNIFVLLWRDKWDKCIHNHKSCL